MLPSVVPAGETLLSLIDEQAQRQQDRLAFQDRNTQLSHIEVVRRANRIAHAILDRDASDHIVGILLPHSVHMAVAMIGVIKAGRAYVALDPSLPHARLIELCADAGVRLLVTDIAHSDLAAQLAQHESVKIDGNPIQWIAIEDTETFPDDAPSVTITPESPLALIYTSGSTGKPKGVMQYHGLIVQGILESRQYANEKSRGLFISPFNVIGAITFIFGTLIVGGSLHLVDVTVEGLADIPARIQTEGITVYQSTPTIFRYWASQYRHIDMSASPFPTLAIVSLSGEATRSDDFELFKRIAPPMCLLISGFGSTEIGGITANMLFPSTKVQPGTIPAGPVTPMRPILLLDENGQPVPQGEVGEIVVPVDAKTTGYWRDDNLTAAKFRPHPTDPNMRLYFMGDLARIDESGMLIHVGRTDFQVKIRGVRIELGEVEAILNTHPAVQESAAVAVTRMNAVTGVDEQVLIAFVVPNRQHPTPADANELRAFLRKRLPETSIPSRISMLDALPRVSGGKIDVRALRALDTPAAAPETTVVRTRELESGLIALWKQTLGVDSIGLDDDFFALGGHSLLAAHLLSQVRVKFNLPIQLTDFAASPTLRTLISASAQHTPVSPYLVPIRTPETPMRPPLFCFPLTDGLTVAYWRIAQYLGEGQPVYALDAQGVNSDLPPQERIEDMAALYIREMRKVQPKGSYFLYGYSFGGVIAFEVARQLVAAGERVGFLGILDTVFPGFGHNTLKETSARNPVIRRAKTGLTVLQTAMTIPIRYRTWYLRRIAARVLNRRRRDNQPSIDNSPPLPAHLKRIETAHHHAYFHYVPSRYTGCIDYFFASDRRLDRQLFAMLRSLTSGGYTIHEVSGSHFRLAQEPHVQTVAASLRNALNDALRALDA